MHLQSHPTQIGYCCDVALSPPILEVCAYEHRKACDVLSVVLGIVTCGRGVSGFVDWQLVWWRKVTAVALHEPLHFACVWTDDLLAG